MANTRKYYDYNLLVYSKGEIPCYKHGKKLYFFRDEIINFIRDGKKKTIKDILAEAESYNLSRIM